MIGKQLEKQGTEKAAQAKTTQDFQLSMSSLQIEPGISLTGLWDL